MDIQEQIADGTSFAALGIEDRIHVLAVLITDTLALQMQGQELAVEEIEN